VGRLPIWVFVYLAACTSPKDFGAVAAVPGEACADIGRTESCYTGPEGSLGVGVCFAGTTTCTWELVWSTCEGQHLPDADQDNCTGDVDDDCDGTVDEGPDYDGDGWGVCEGDCCDDTSCAADPTRVNPGAFEADANILDDDCDGTIDNVDPGCTAGDPADDPTDAMAFAQALDLCRTTTAEAEGIKQRWGVISATLTRADGGPLPTLDQAAIRGQFGVNQPRFGDSLVVLATGPAGDRADPVFQPWQDGTDVQGGGDDGSVPSSWLTANGGKFPSAPGCPPALSVQVNDPVMLTLKIRVPTNANSFNISSNFFSAEYPEYVCTEFNDIFIMLLTSSYRGQPANPRDGNLAIYTDAEDRTFPVGVNLAQGTGLFQQCVNGTTGCAGQVSGVATGCVSQADLAGTGFDEPGVACGDPGSVVGGGTGWLNTRGNVTPGEIITLRIAVWDTSDALFDSAALIDSFQWNIDPTTPGTGEVPPL